MKTETTSARILTILVFLLIHIYQISLFDNKCEDNLMEFEKRSEL